MFATTVEEVSAEEKQNRGELIDRCFGGNNQVCVSGMARDKEDMG